VATLIDSLVISIGLDTKQLDEGQRDAIAKLRQLESSTQAHIKPVEAGFNQLIGTFKEFQSRLLGISALIAGGVGLDRLVGDLARANTQTAYLANSLGQTNRELTKLQAAAVLMGQSKEDATATATAIGNNAASFSYGQGSSLRRLAGSYPGLNASLDALQQKYGANAPPSEVLLALSKFATQEERDPNRARYALGQVGLPQGAINMALQGPEKLRQALKEAEQFETTEKQVEASKKLVESFGKLSLESEKLARIIVTDLAPALITFLGWITKITGAMQAPAGADAPVNETGSFWTDSPFGRAWKRLRGGGGGTPLGGGGASGSSSSSSSPSGTGTSPEGQQPQSSGGSSSFSFGDAWKRIKGAVTGTSPESPKATAPGQTGGGPSSNQANRPYYMGGMGYMEGFGKFHWGSGGAGSGSIPYGDYPITPGTVGPWGSAHGAIGLNNNAIRDPKTGRLREGIELHASSSRDLDHLYTLGCFAVPQNEWPAFKRHLLSEIANNGPMYLHIGPNGTATEASITHRSGSRVPSASLAGGSSLGTFNQWKQSQGLLSRRPPAANSSTTHNTSSSATSIGTMNVSVPQGANPGDYADGIREHLERVAPVYHSLTGMN
jgi:hypothetical protein